MSNLWDDKDTEKAKELVDQYYKKLKEYWLNSAADKYLYYIIKQIFEQLAKKAEKRWLAKQTTQNIDAYFEWNDYTLAIKLAEERRATASGIADNNNLKISNLAKRQEILKRKQKHGAPSFMDVARRYVLG